MDALESVHTQQPFCALSFVCLAEQKVIMPNAAGEHIEHTPCSGERWSAARLGHTQLLKVFE